MKKILILLLASLAGIIDKTKCDVYINEKRLMRR